MRGKFTSSLSCFAAAGFLYIGEATINMFGGRDMQYVYIAVYALAVIALFFLVPKFLEYSWPEKCIKSLKMKMICAAMFIITAVCCMLYADNFGQYAIYLLIGLLFGALGDLLIHVPNHGVVNVLGGAAFLVGHIFYIIAFYHALKSRNPEAKPVTLITVILPIAFVICYFIFITVKKVKIGVLTVPVIIYALTIISMLTMGGRLAFEVMSVPVFITVLLGAVLFVCSDSTIALFMFGKQFQTKPVKNFYIITYFAAQVLLGTSIVFIK